MLTIEVAAIGSTSGVPQGDYDKVQYFGFNLFTAPGTDADGCFNETGGALNTCYLGCRAVNEDLSRRLEIMRVAIERTYSLAEWDRSPRTLKIFLAPEFYWRGARGAYRINPEMKRTSKLIMNSLMELISDERFQHWIVVPGTMIVADKLDPEFAAAVVPFGNITYYDFAPLFFGGTRRVMLNFKHFISSEDFLRATPESRRVKIVPPPPGNLKPFCDLHPDSNGCIFGKLSPETLKALGFDEVEVMEHDIFHWGGLTIGLEICLDHAQGMLADYLGPDRTIDIQLIISAGMSICSGSVVTSPGGPVFLADGFSLTQMSLNQYGDGKRAILLPSGDWRFNTGVVYQSNAILAIKQWLADGIDMATGTGFGENVPGAGTLPGGSKMAGRSYIKFSTISALGEKWLELLAGYYDIGSYLALQEVFKRVRQDSPELGFGNMSAERLTPTVDIYGPLDIFVTGWNLIPLSP